MEKKRIVIGLAWVAAGLLAAMQAQAQAEEKPEPQEKSPKVIHTYAAKFICGVQRDGDINSVPDAQAGRYSTKINVHNNTGVPIKFRKKIIQVKGGQDPIGPQAKVFEALKPDYAMEVVCRDIYKHLNTGGGIPPYIEGFVIFEVLGPTQPPVRDSLDVVGVYTYRGDFPNNPGTVGATGASISVVVYPAKTNVHALQ